jgi:hypothetical protein
MPVLTRIRWNGNLHTALEYGPPRRLIEHFGTVQARIQITDAEAALGLDELARRYFPQPKPPRVYYGA